MRMRYFLVLLGVILYVVAWFVAGSATSSMEPGSPWRYWICSIEVSEDFYELATGAIVLGLILSSAIGVWWCVKFLIVHRRRRRWVSLGLCPSCGYDVRASGERCSECGTTIQRKGNDKA
jgi:hypothetical protein